VRERERDFRRLCDKLDCMRECMWELETESKCSVQFPLGLDIQYILLLMGNACFCGNVWVTMVI